ncbi:MAG TPA: lytic murein transglycosylase B, partial [Candidatus Tenderia electrophaga]|nr:lytic murein transglycosylase B [Candidatus Tenderia electrophaga]
MHKRWQKPILSALLCGTLIAPQLGQANTAQRQDVNAFIDRLTSKHDFKRDELEKMFAQVELQAKIIDAMNRPYEGKPWHQYRPIFVTRARINEGAKFLQENYQTLKQAEQKYGVPAEIITAILGVETRYGRYRGKYRVIDALATLGFDYPRRSKFFLKELEAFLLLSREEGFEPLAITSSYAGAMGKPQFMPSSYRMYAVDFDGDGVRDLLDNSADAIGSIANYLARHGWQRNQPIAVKTTAAQQGPQKMGKLKKPRQPVQHWLDKGYQPIATTAPQLKADLIVLENKQGPEYWLGLQ